MAREFVGVRIISALNNTMRRLACRRAGIAMIVALSAPMLVAMTGFAVDIGYWYQQQESLQSAADAAALAAATADAKYGDNSASLAQPFGVSAANTATNNQFGLTSCAGAPCGAGTVLVTMTGPTTLSNGRFLKQSAAMWRWNLR